MEIIQDCNILRQKSTYVESVEEAKDIINKLEKCLSITSNGVGLAAIQIGISKQVGVIYYNDISLHLINPEIIEVEDEIVFLNEGCLSFPNVYFDTKRYKHLTIKTDVIDGNEFRKETQYFYYAYDNTEMGNDGLLAIAVQHEIDHFNGKLITDHRIVQKPIIVQKKVGRNDLCPCGSNKKYKKCCG